MTRPQTFMERTQDEVIASFLDRYEELQHSCERYDGGRLAEAPRLGLLVFLLVADEGQRSLLTQVGKRDMSFMDSRHPVAPGREKLPRGGLQLARVVLRDTHWGFEPSLSTHGMPEMIARKKWLSRVVLSDDLKKTYTTRDVFEFFRHKEGGGHYDPRIEEGFARLLRDKKLGLKVTDVNGAELDPLAGPLQATMRQIAYELELSIRVSCSDILHRQQPVPRWNPPHPR